MCQINADKIKAGQRSFRSREQQLHGDCDVTYTVSKQAVRKTVSHTEDCENRVYRIVDDWRSFRCDGKTTNEGSGYPSSFTSTAFQVRGLLKGCYHHIKKTVKPHPGILWQSTSTKLHPGNK